MSIWTGSALLLLASVMLALIWRLHREVLLQIAESRAAQRSASSLSTVNKSLEGRIQQEIQSREDALAQLAASHRLATLGELAGGIAHDINNVLQTISGATSLVQAHSLQDDENQRLTEITLSAADRGSSITQRVLAFARPGAIQTDRICLDELLPNLRELLARTLQHGMSVELDLDDNLPDFQADRMQLETVIINLATNARDAMPDGGTITIKGNIDQEVPPTRRCVQISIADTGTGMDAETLARATEPFFSTKEIGQGTGIGLSMAKAFVEQSEGSIEITSRLGKGTTVALRFPTIEAAEALPPPATPVALPRKPRDRRDRRVLVVDDNIDSRELIGELLIDSGFAVHHAGSGAEAMERIEAGIEIDLLLTDLSMPKMNGMELIQLARKLLADLPAIVLTGDTGAIAELRLEDGTAIENCTVLQKPIRARVLADEIALILG